MKLDTVSCIRNWCGVIPLLAVIAFSPAWIPSEVIGVAQVCFNIFCGGLVVLVLIWTREVIDACRKHVGPTSTATWAYIVVTMGTACVLAYLAGIYMYIALVALYVICIICAVFD